MPPIITALCSYGMSGEVFHAPFIESNPSFSLKYILERTKNRSAQRYPNAQLVRSYEEILSDESVQLVVVNTPHALHYPMAKEALEANKHVVIEKPFAVTAEECLELEKLAEDKGLMIAVYHNKRLEGDYLYFESLLNEAKLGKLKEVEIRYDRWKPEPGHKTWKEHDLPGAGILYDLGSHLIDFSLSLFGKPNMVAAKEYTERTNSPIPDAFDLTLAYDEFEVKLGASMMTKEPGPKVSAIWEHGSLVIKGNDPQEALLIEGVSPLDKTYQENDTLQEAELKIGKDSKLVSIPMGDYNNFYEQVAGRVLFGKPLNVSTEEATNVLHVIQTVRS